MLDKRRVKREIVSLIDAYDMVDYNLESADVWVRNHRFPPGWEPRRGDVWFDLGNSYPASPPDVLFPEEMSYYGARPEIKLDNRGPDGWSVHCIHDELADGWVPGYHTLRSMMRMVDKSFQHPNDERPWERDYDR